MLDRFRNAQWIHGVPPTGTVRHETGVYGTLACGHPTIVADTAGHSCNRSGRQEDQEANARLISQAPALLQVAYLAVEMGWGGEHHPDCDDEGEEEPVTGCICGLSEVFATIAKVEGRA